VKILVCVKQVPETDAVIKIDAAGKWVETSESMEFRMNRFDENATEAAILLKEAHPGTSIDIISVGPNRAAVTIKRALSMGADHGIHIVAPDQGYLSPFLIATWIASVARDRDYDLILAGVMSEDAMQGQVGPMLAEILGIPCATSVVFAQLEPGESSAQVKREIEGGLKELLKLSFPALLTIQSGINKPRYPSLSNIIRANKLQLEIFHASIPEQQVVREEVLRVGLPPRARSGSILSGTADQKAAQLLEIIGTKISIR
jgi:electron transfer flavoprotein beta subunit